MSLPVEGGPFPFGFAGQEAVRQPSGPIAADVVEQRALNLGITPHELAARDAADARHAYEQRHQRVSMVVAPALGGQVLRTA